VRDALGLILEVESWKRKYDQTILYKLKAWLFGNEQFLSLYTSLDKLYRDLRVSPRALEQNVIILERTLDTTNTAIVIKREPNIDIIDSLMKHQFIIGLTARFDNYINSIKENVVRSSITHTDTILSAQAKAIVLKILFLENTEIHAIKVKNESFLVDLPVFYDQFLTFKKDLNLSDITGILNILILQNKLQDVFFKFTNNIEGINTVMSELKKRHKLPKKFGLDSQKLLSDNISFVSALSFKANSSLVLGLTNQKIILYRTGDDLEMKTLIKMQRLFLGKSYDPYFSKLATTVEDGEGEYSLNSNRHWVLEKGDKLMFSMDNREILSISLTFENTLRIFRTQNWFSIGKTMYKDEDGWKEINRYYTPWYYNDMHVDAKLYKDDKLILGSPIEDLTLQVYMQDTIETLSNRFSEYTTNVKEILQAVLKSETQSILFEVTMLNSLKNKFNIKGTIKEYETIEGMTLHEGFVRRSIPRFDNSDKDNDSLIKSLSDYQNDDLILKFEKMVLIHFLMIYCTVLLGYPMNKIEVTKKFKIWDKDFNAIEVNTIE